MGCPLQCRSRPNQAHLQGALSRFAPGGRTALFDAVIAALDHLERASLQKRVLVVLSDGEDNASSYSEKDMMTRAARSDAIVYTVSSADHGTGQDSDPDVLKKLAYVTGGARLLPEIRSGRRHRVQRDCGQYPPRLQHRVRPHQHGA
jgi:Mg-chelatase subunit ChlD